MRTVADTTDTLYWLFSDHLSSTSIITDESGTIISEMKYTAFGEIRDINGTSPTDYLYTGQRKEVEFGLSYYVARWYDPQTGHFVQADSIIPQPGNAEDWDRYAYVLNNPLKYTDPSGHYYNGPEMKDYYEQNQYNNNKYNVPPATTNLIIEIGGVGNSSSGASGNYDPRNSYIVTYDVDDYKVDDKANKEKTSKAITAYLNSSYADHVENVYLNAHSAGADTGILTATATSLLNDNIKGVALSDPTLSASPDYMEVGDMAPLLEDILKAGITVVVAHGNQGYPAIRQMLDPDIKLETGGTYGEYLKDTYPNYYFKYFEHHSHSAMATATDMIDYIKSIFFP